GPQSNGVGDGTAVLMGEVTTPPRDALMHAGDHHAARGAVRRALRVLRETALDVRPCLFLGAEAARGGTLPPPRAGGKRLQADLYADLLSRFWQWRGVGTRAGDADIPRAGVAAAEGGRLGRALQRTRQDDLDRPDPVHPQTARVRVQFAADRYQGGGE